MRAGITRDGVEIDGTLLPTPPTDSAMERAFGAAYREVRIPLHGGELRRIRVFDALGVAHFLDGTPPQVPEILFVLSPADAPFSVGSPFDGEVRVNDAVLTADMTAANLPVAGPLQFEAEFGHRWRAATPRFSVWLILHRRRNNIGRRAGTPRLTAVAMCYEALAS